MKIKRLKLVLLLIISTAIILAACTDKPDTIIKDSGVNNSTSSAQQSSNEKKNNTLSEQQSSNSISEENSDNSIPTQVDEPQATQNEVKASQTQEVGAKENKKMLKDRLYSELKDHFNKVQAGEKTEYNKIMTVIKGKGLLTTFRGELSKEELKLTRSHYMDVLLKYCPVSGGYSSDGISFIAVVSPKDSQSDIYKDAINEIRGLDDEYEFMSNICNIYPDPSYYLGIDLYAEDLLGIKKEIKVDKIIIWDSADEGTPEFKETELDFEAGTVEEVEYFLKHNRKPVKSPNIIKNKGWNTYIYNNVPAILYLQIVIEYNGEFIRLER